MYENRGVFKGNKVKSFLYLLCKQYSLIGIIVILYLFREMHVQGEGDHVCKNVKSYIVL